MDIDDAVVISLPTRKKRLKAFERERPTERWPFPVPRAVPGVTAEAPGYFRASAGAFGCAQAHVRELTQAWRSGVGSLLVLEDDAIFVEDFGLRWKQFAAHVPDSWDMIMLGGQHWQDPVWEGRIQRCTGTVRTHGYIVRDKAMPLLIRTWSKASTHIDHYLPALQKDMLRVYCPTPLLVGQRAGTSDTSPTVSKNDRFWDERSELLHDRPGHRVSIAQSA
jgi:GR25 family glycosyltransferase involved in LPS biosynthesis